ncbi:MAG: flavodoxin [Oscillospiraceae bacterium]|jgi:flavodoxin|nr:flavodoxin [Oscillospiraceae bacterium]
MKKRGLSILLMLMLFTLAACTNQSGNTTTPTPESTSETQEEVSDTNEPAGTAAGERKILVVYFSLPETTDPNNMTEDEENSAVVVDGEVLGNTQYVAYLIQDYLNADIFRIEPKTPYPTEHATLIEVANEELSTGARPALLAGVENIEQYDVVFVGYPNWWGDMPMILYTFFEEYDFSGKTIIPFNTHGGSGFSGTISSIAELAPNATVERNGYSVSRSVVENCKDDLEQWLQGLGF